MCVISYTQIHRFILSVCGRRREEVACEGSVTTTLVLIIGYSIPTGKQETTAYSSSNSSVVF